MRLVFRTGKSTLDIIKQLGIYCEEDDQSAIVTDSIHFHYQIESLLNSGFKFAIIDPDGKQFIIAKGKEEEEDELESDEREAG